MTLAYEDFVKEVKLAGIKCLHKEVTEYVELGELPQLYAIGKDRLVGCYSEKQGGVVFPATRKGSRWSKSGRKFIKQEF